MLAVVLPVERSTPAPDHAGRKAEVTQWGADPVWVAANAGKLATFAPEPADFPLAVWDSPLPDPGLQGYPAEERQLPAGPGGRLQTGPWPPLGDNRVIAVPHMVGFDAGRGLWYADIVIRPQQAYFPFVRLGLARYQPCSVEGAHLSPVVLTEFQQLAPDRLAVVSDVSRAGVTVKRVAVHGVAPPAGNAGQSGGDIRVEVQRLPAGADPGLGWVTVPAQAVPAHPGRTPPEPWLVSRRDPGNRRLTRLQLEQQARAREWLQAGRVADLLRERELLQWVLMPQIASSEVVVPAPQAGERQRLLVTELEHYPGGPGAATRSRVVYAEVVPL